MSLEGLGPHTPTVRILLVGDCGSGKGALARQLCYGDANAEPDTSSGCELHTCVLMLPSTPHSPPEPVLVELVVAPGYRKNEALRAPLYRSSDAVIVVYDTRGRRAARSVPLWREEVADYLMEKGLWIDNQQTKPNTLPLDLTGEAFFGPNGAIISRNFKNFGKSQNSENQPTFPVALLGIRWGGRAAIHTHWANVPFLGPYFECLPDPFGEHERDGERTRTDAALGDGGDDGGEDGPRTLGGAARGSNSQEAERRFGVMGDVELGRLGRGGSGGGEGGPAGCDAEQENERLLTHTDSMEAGTGAKNAAVCVADLVSLVLKSRREHARELGPLQAMPRHTHEYVLRDMHGMHGAHSMRGVGSGRRDSVAYPGDEDEQGKESGRSQKSGFLGWVSSVTQNVGNMLGLAAAPAKASMSRSYSGTPVPENASGLDHSRPRTLGEYTSIRHRSTSGSRYNPALPAFTVSGTSGVCVGVDEDGNGDDDEHSHLYSPREDTRAQQYTYPQPQPQPQPHDLYAVGTSSRLLPPTYGQRTHTTVPTAASSFPATGLPYMHTHAHTSAHLPISTTAAHAPAHAAPMYTASLSAVSAGARGASVVASPARQAGPSALGVGADAPTSGYEYRPTTDDPGRSAYSASNPPLPNYHYPPASTTIAHSGYGVLPEGYDVPQYNLAQLTAFTPSGVAHPPQAGSYAMSEPTAWLSQPPYSQYGRTPQRDVRAQYGSGHSTGATQGPRGAQYYEDKAYSGGSLYDE